MLIQMKMFPSNLQLRLLIDAINGNFDIKLYKFMAEDSIDLLNHQSLTTQIHGFFCYI